MRIIFLRSCERKGGDSFKAPSTVAGLGRKSPQRLGVISTRGSHSGPNPGVPQLSLLHPQPAARHPYGALPGFSSAQALTGSFSPWERQGQPSSGEAWRERQAGCSPVTARGVGGASGAVTPTPPRALGAPGSSCCETTAGGTAGCNN